MRKKALILPVVFVTPIINPLIYNSLQLGGIFRFEKLLGKDMKNSYISR